MSSVRVVGFGFHGKLANQQQTTISSHNKVTSSSSSEKHIGKGDGCGSQHVARHAVGNGLRVFLAHLQGVLSRK